MRADLRGRVRPDEAVTVALLAVFGGMLVPVSVIDDPFVWVGWAGVTAVIAGAALLTLNR